MTMEVKLIVAHGKHAGREIPVPISKFLVGRAEDCHLRVHSELISRHHCVFLVEEGFVAVRDFQSKNGTFVNGDRIAPQAELKSGDRVQVGPMELEVQIRSSVAAASDPARQPTSAGGEDRMAAPQPGTKDLHVADPVAGAESLSENDDTVTMFPADLAKVARQADNGTAAPSDPEQGKPRSP